MRCKDSYVKCKVYVSRFYVDYTSKKLYSTANVRQLHYLYLSNVERLVNLMDSKCDIYRISTRKRLHDMDV